MPDFSHSALQAYLKKLSLRPGDILIVHNPEVLKQLQALPAMEFYVPVVFCGPGDGLEKANREQVLEILERIDEAQYAAESHGRVM